MEKFLRTVAGARCVARGSPSNWTRKGSIWYRPGSKREAQSWDVGSIPADSTSDPRDPIVRWAQRVTSTPGLKDRRVLAPLGERLGEVIR